MHRSGWSPRTSGGSPIDGLDLLNIDLALCSLHHELLDRGSLDLDTGLRVLVSSAITARTSLGRAAYALHGHELMPRPGTAVPPSVHVEWHTREVFKGVALAA